jgi:uncharacterized protein (TIGR02246 family)
MPLPAATHHDRECVMRAADEAAIRRLIDDLVAAWNRGDAEAFGARYRDDGTFTNVFGAFHFGREEFLRRHAEVFRGFLKETTIAMSVRKLRFVRPDVAVLDADMAYAGFQTLPAGVQAMPDGLVHSSLLMVLVKDAGDWWIAAYHNIWQSPAR